MEPISVIKTPEDHALALARIDLLMAMNNGDGPDDADVVSPISVSSAFPSVTTMS